MLKNMAKKRRVWMCVKTHPDTPLRAGVGGKSAERRQQRSGVRSLHATVQCILGFYWPRKTDADADAAHRQPARHRSKLTKVTVAQCPTPQRGTNWSERPLRRRPAKLINSRDKSSRGNVVWTRSRCRPNRPPPLLPPYTTTNRFWRSEIHRRTRNSRPEGGGGLTRKDVAFKTKKTHTRNT